MMRQQWLVFVPVTLATAGLAACASVLGGEQVKIRPVDTMQTLTTAPRDPLYESAVSAINERDYGRALEYLQAAKAKDPRNVKALNALGVVYDKLGRFDLSARYYAQARAVEPESRIVAENMGYSRVLQRLLNPNQPIAVATIDLPPGLTNPASTAGATPPAATADQTVAAATTVSTVPVLPVTEKKVIDASPPMVTAVPLTLPDTRPLFASTIYSEPMAPMVERKLIDSPPPTVTAMSLELPDAKRVFADVTLPEPVMPVTEKRLIDTPPPTVTAAFQPLDARRLFADVTLPEPVMAVTEKRLIDTPPPTVTAAFQPLDARRLFANITLPEPVMAVTEKRLIDTPPPTVMAVFQPLDARRVFADVILPEPVMPVTEKKLIDAPAPSVTAVPFVLPDTKPSFAALSPAVLSSPVSGREGARLAEPVASAATLTVALSAARPVAAPAISPAPAAMRAVEQKPAAQSARSAGALPASAPARLAMATTPISVSSVPPQAEARKTAAAVPAILAVAPKPAAKPVVVATANPTAPLSPKPVAAASIHEAAVAPVRKTVEKPVTVASARPAVPVLPARQPAPVAPVKQLAVKAMPAKAKVLIIGQPIKLVNASGKPGGAGTVLRRLTTLGWTMRPADSRSQPATMLFYPVQNLAAAKAMQRTLPFPVRLVAESGKSAGMRLVIGRDYLSWKPRNARIAVLWQKRMVIASSQKLSLRGVR